MIKSRPSLIILFPRSETRAQAKLSSLSSGDRDKTGKETGKPRGKQAMATAVSLSPSFRSGRLPASIASGSQRSPASISSLDKKKKKEKKRGTPLLRADVDEPGLISAVMKVWARPPSAKLRPCPGNILSRRETPGDCAGRRPLPRSPTASTTRIIELCRLHGQDEIRIWHDVCVITTLLPLIDSDSSIQSPYPPSDDCTP